MLRLPPEPRLPLLNDDPLLVLLLTLLLLLLLTVDPLRTVEVELVRVEGEALLSIWRVLLVLLAVLRLPPKERGVGRLSVGVALLAGRFP